MNWNYRVIERTSSTGEVTRAIHAVYYKDDKPSALSCDPATVTWDAEDIFDGRRILEKMLAAMKKPSLTQADFSDDQ